MTRSNIVQRQAEEDLEKFKAFIEARGSETGGWRGAVNEDVTVGIPGAEDAVLSEGDSGKAGVSGKAVAAGAAAAVAGVAAAAAMSGRSDDSADSATGPDVVDVLTTDHHEVTALIGEIWVTTDAEKRRDLADTVISELVRHSVAEEMYVYPAMRKHLPNGDAAVEHDTTEHKQLESTMKQLEAVDASDPQFTELLRQLETILADHVADEERDQFPQLRARIPARSWCRWPGRSRRPRRSLRRGRTRARRTTRSSTSWWAPASASWTACATSFSGRTDS